MTGNPYVDVTFWFLLVFIVAVLWQHFDVWNWIERTFLGVEQEVPRIQAVDSPIVIKKGTIATCPNCGVEIAEVLNDLRLFDLLKASDFRGISQEIKQFDATQCKKCGAWYFHHGKLHTKDGWVP